MPGEFSPFQQMQWVEFRNDAGETIPAFGIVRLTGIAAIDATRVVLTAAKPNVFGCQHNAAINGPTAVSSGRYGVCTRAAVDVALYDTADGTPAFGEKWGPRDGSWKLKKNTGGFSVLGPTNPDQGLVLVSPAPMRMFVGKTDGTHNKGGSGTISIYAGTLGSETDTGLNMTGVYNRFATLTSGKWVRCEWNETDGAWEITAAEC
jgi:hypothetical protein